jgi:hypothetical protein
MSRLSGVYPIPCGFYGKTGRLDDGQMRLQVDKCTTVGAGALGLGNSVGLV